MAAWMKTRFERLLTARDKLGRRLLTRPGTTTRCDPNTQMEDLHVQRNHRRRSKGRTGLGGPRCQRETLLVLIWESSEYHREGHFKAERAGLLPLLSFGGL